MILLLEIRKDIGGEGNGERKERRVGAAGWASMFSPSPLPSQLKYHFIDISLAGLSDLSKKREAAALFHPGRSLDDAVSPLELSELPRWCLGEG